MSNKRQHDAASVSSMNLEIAEGILKLIKLFYTEIVFTRGKFYRIYQDSGISLDISKIIDLIKIYDGWNVVRGGKTITVRLNPNRVKSIVAILKKRLAESPNVVVRRANLT